MGLGSTAKKLQQIADMAEDVYARLNALREQVTETRATVDETKARVDDMDRELAEQRALVEALAERQGVDVDAVTAEVHVVDAESAAGDDGDDSDTQPATDA
jgi:septal ring factor EnvC (AmiA/AmiB activator)